MPGQGIAPHVQVEAIEPIAATLQTIVFVPPQEARASSANPIRKILSPRDEVADMSDPP